MPRTGAALSFSRADAAFAAALRTAIAKARLRGVIDPGMGPVLFALEERGVVTMSDLATAACVPRSTMTGIVTRMEDRMLVRTAPNPQDGRGIVVALTTKGRSVVPRVRAIERDLDEKIRGVLADGEASQLVDLLDRLAGAFSTS
jgi:DNA-binding MarR family transcriptional regulator